MKKYGFLWIDRGESTLKIQKKKKQKKKRDFIDAQTGPPVYARSTTTRIRVKRLPPHTSPPSRTTRDRHDNRRRSQNSLRFRDRRYYGTAACPRTGSAESDG